MAEIGASGFGGEDGRGALKKRARKGIPRSFEVAALTAGFGTVAGVDEAGRGPLAGPVVAAAVILPVGCSSLPVNDSKKLSPKKREQLYERILDCAIDAKIASVGTVSIDKMNIYRAALTAMKLAVEGLGAKPGFVIIDGPAGIDVDIPQLTLVGGDARCFSVAAASILAKVSRDRRMVEYDELYPGYGFAAHKGYGTREHMEAIRRLGPCPIHRRTFSPVREMFGE